MAHGRPSPQPDVTQLSLLYVVGAGSVVGFNLDSHGHLTQIENSTESLTANASGGASIAFRPDGHFLLVTEHLANNIDAFTGDNGIFWLHTGSSLAHEFSASYRRPAHLLVQV